MRPEFGAPSGVGRYGVLDRDDDGRPVCHECGRAFEQLATHTRTAHGLTAARYREKHGLSTRTRLIGTATAARLSEAWYEHETEHLARLDAARDVDAARAGNTAAGQRRAERVARRIEASSARRVDLIPAQVAELGDLTDMQGWADRARALIERDGVSHAAIARAVGLANGSVVWNRLRRYPPV
ncbi:MAG: MucR family transcriptional regulator [Tessaracoccus sp.]|uniref:MucR family transcriptional regulator n=1 Tax=Tessaracoccus sp. TaxID=1971211 RepID=UPI001EBFD824|nr:MucR family transcriptional regulator [Tessaracoccus sp.]MBK7822804.1 MucR family transcriptional regulator [Tessaracoccus sp.]